MSTRDPSQADFFESFGVIIRFPHTIIINSFIDIGDCLDLQNHLPSRRQSLAVVDFNHIYFHSDESNQIVD